MIVLSIIKRMDWLLNAVVLFLVAAGLLTIYSINQDLFYQQLIWTLLALLVIVFFALLDWRPLINYRSLVFGFYFFVIGLLFLTYFFAPVIRSARSWLVLGPIQLQPAELVKPALIIVYAYFFAKRHVGIAHWYNLILSFLYFFIPAVLILIQPDLGTVLILFGLWFGFLLISGLRLRHLIFGIIVLTLLSFWGWQNFLADYQKERIIGALNPNYDPLGINYSVIQSKIAIGSAGFWGKGYGRGSQVQLGFLPEAATDFVFASFVEEWGLVGALFLVLAFLILSLRLIQISLRSHRNFGTFVGLGTALLFLLHFIFNLGFNLGLLPVVGVSLPLLSYGGSNLLTNALLIGIIQSIVIRASF